MASTGSLLAWSAKADRVAAVEWIVPMRQKMRSLNWRQSTDGRLPVSMQTGKPMCHTRERSLEKVSTVS